MGNSEEYPAESGAATLERRKVALEQATMFHDVFNHELNIELSVLLDTAEKFEEWLAR